MVLLGYSGARGTLIYEKNLKPKISCQTPFKGGQKSRLMEGFLLMWESMNQPAPELESSVPTVTVGVLRAEKPEDASQWRCNVPTCSEG